MQNIFIIAAASGTGKTSLASALSTSLENIKVSISHTTRPIRSGEKADESYFFVDEATFKSMIDAEEFLEYAQVFGHYYGTSKKWVKDRLREGQDVILDIDWQGAHRIRELMPENTVSIFLLPPSASALRHRLKTRNRDHAEIVEDRFKRASGEIEHYNEFDYLIVNDDFDDALSDLISIVKAHRLKLERQELKYQKLLEDLLWIGGVQS